MLLVKFSEAVLFLAESYL